MTLVRKFLLVIAELTIAESRCYSPRSDYRINTVEGETSNIPFQSALPKISRSKRSDKAIARRITKRRAKLKGKV